MVLLDKALDFLGDGIEEDVDSLLFVALPFDRNLVIRNFRGWGNG